jgi:phage tail sheath protein FI
MHTPFTSSRLPLGAPGVYALAPVEAPRLHPQHMDVCAFVGVAPRGPAYQPEAGRPGESACMMMADPARACRRSVPVLVHSFDEYRSLFGAYEGPGYLPYAVAMFFEQGGRSAYIVRIVHEYDAPAPGDPAPWREAWAHGAAHGLAAGALPFLARNEGSWGNALRIAAGYGTGALAYTWREGEACVDRAGAAPAGTLLRLWSADGAQALAYCRGALERRPQDFPLSRWALVLDPAPPFEPVRIDTVQAWLEVREVRDDGGHGDEGRSERHQDLGLSPLHPRWIGTVLCEESLLLWPDPSWAAQELWPARTEVELLQGGSAPFTGGRDRYGDVLHEDFFDAQGLTGDADGARAGLSALEACPEVTHVVVPDLYVPAQWAGVDAVTDTVDSAAGAEFSACVDLPPGSTTITSVAPTALRQLILDPRHFADLNAIAALQQQVLDVCELRGAMIALLDVPPGLSQAQAMRWRAQFGSSWGAAYHPWLVASRTVPRGTAPAHPSHSLRPLPPSAVAAGIIARKEIERGIQFGPANEVARAIVRLAEPQPAGRADAFHPLGLNCFVRGQDGVQLVSARTLSRDRAWRQLSVRRLMLMLERTLLRETQWAVFEPNGPVLWRDLQHAIDNLLLRLFRAGAWAGATPAESYFVRINREPARLERGELLVEIGVAPAEPLEFIVLCLRRDGDGTLTLER